LNLPPEYEVVQLDFPTPCWIWQRAKHDTGYGALRVDGKTRLAHRVYYERYVAPIPQGWVVHHMCWNKACVNPEHLEAATLTANNQGCLSGADCTIPQHRWVRRPRKARTQYPVGKLPYEIQDRGGESPCWIWRRWIGKGGYPRTYLNGEEYYAHRIFHGPVPEGMVVDHLCSQPSCVNPAHLEAVTQRENQRRKIARQRAEAKVAFLAHRDG
jgi:hypothetical protein